MQKRFVSIWFPLLATDWFSSKQPQLGNAAFVLETQSCGHTIMNAPSPEAKAQGIRTGMVLADARAIFPSLQVFDDKPTLPTKLLHCIAEWCIRFTLAAAPDAHDGIILNATGCTHLWDIEDAYNTDISKRLVARGYTARVAIADSIGTAWTVARFG